MEAAAHPHDEHDHHHHHDHDDVELNPATWTDAKRYAWLLGLIIPFGPVHRLGLGRGDRLGRLLVLRPGPRLRRLPAARHRDRRRPDQPARQHPQVARAGPLLPLVHLPLHPGPVRRPRLRLLALGQRRPLGLRMPRPRGDDGRRRRDRDQHRPRARPQAGELGALAEQDRPRPDRLRPLLHRAQPRPPRPRRHPGGPGQLAPGGELLGLPAAHRLRQRHVGLGHRGRPPRPPGQVALDAATTTSSAPGR